MSKIVDVITGAGSGLGQLAARRALKAGHSVVAIDVNQNGLDQIGDSSNLLKLMVDVTDAKAVQDAINGVEESVGPITRVINAAAIMPMGLLLEQDLGIVHKIMAINYGGLVNVSKAALPNMVKRGRGDFISFSSLAGHMPILYMGGYHASKFAVSAFTEVLYHENRGRGVRFVCVCPPPVATPLLDQARSTVWPRLFDTAPAISPDEVLDATERALGRGEFWVFPGPLTRLYYLARRFVPAAVWWRVHQVEGR